MSNLTVKDLELLFTGRVSPAAQTIPLYLITDVGNHNNDKFYAEFEDTNGKILKSMLPSFFLGKLAPGNVVAFGTSHIQRDLWLTFPGIASNEIMHAPTPTYQRYEKEFLLEYVGAARTRSDGASRANAWCAGGWNVKIADITLRDWFSGVSAQQFTDATRYGVLGISQTATDDEIRKAYFRMAKQWHPDVCKESNANEIFLRIKESYEVLRDPRKRQKYDVGLAFQSKTPKEKRHNFTQEFYPPLRCGIVTLAGIQIGRTKFYADKILAWRDDVQNGKTRVASWAKDSKMFETRWV